jgi:hypothetical protein
MMMEISPPPLHIPPPLVCTSGPSLLSFYIMMYSSLVFVRVYPFLLATFIFDFHIYFLCHLRVALAHPLLWHVVLCSPIDLFWSVVDNNELILSVQT